MRVRITQLDGAMPNLALMRLAHFHRSHGDDVNVTRHIAPDMFEPAAYDRVYASAIFKFSADRVDRFRQQWPNAVIGGTGTDNPVKVENVIGRDYNQASYEGFGVDYSLGFTQRGCRLKCKFCVVPQKEGKNYAVGTVNEIWRGDRHPKKIHLLDNDFFGQPDWQARIDEIRDGDFRVCMSQGINVRLLNPEAAYALSTIRYSDTEFKRRRLYTAWDNIGDEKIFFRGVDMLETFGVPAKNLMAFMLVGFDKAETWPRIWRRFNRMVERGIRPYPMVYDRSRKDLTKWQRWVNLGMYRFVRWEDSSDYVPGTSDETEKVAA